MGTGLGHYLMIERGHGNTIALINADGHCTWLQLKAQVDRIAHALTGPMGLVPGNRVLLRGGNNPMMAACWLATVKAGLVAVATMPLLRAKELTEIVVKAEITHALGELARYRAEYGRDHLPFEVNALCIDVFDLDGYKRLEDKGVTELQTVPWYFYGGDPNDLSVKLDSLARFADEVITKL